MNKHKLFDIPFSSDPIVIIGRKVSSYLKTRLIDELELQ